jgi:protein transport protein HofC
LRENAVGRGADEPFASDERGREDEAAARPNADRPSVPRAEIVGDGESSEEVDLALIRARARARPWRLRHLMYLVAIVAVLLWLGTLVADRIVIVAFVLVGGFSMAFISVMGAGVVSARRRMTRQDALLELLAIAAERNMPLAPAVAAFAHQYSGGTHGRVMDLAAHLNWGTALPEALGRVRGLVSRDAGLLAWMGEASGRLPKALRIAVSSRSTRLPIWTAIAARLAYILVILLVIQTIISFILYYIIPKFEAIFKDFGVTLPRITVLIIAWSNMIVRYASPVLLLPFVEAGLLFCIPFSFLAWGDLHVPLFDRLMRRRHTALVLRSLSLIVDGSKPLSLGLATLADHYPTAWVRRRLIQADSEVRQGADWIEALWRHGLVRASDAEVLATATTVGNLAWALAELAETSERRFTTRFQAFVQTAFPLVVLTLGSLVFIIATGFFLPLIQLIERLTDLP